MPRVEQVDGATITIYFADHNPPHFHARQAGSEAQISIRDFTVLKGNVPSLHAVLDWARANQQVLINKWNECNPNNPY